MKLTADRRILAAAVKEVGRCTSKSSPMKILSNVLIDTNGSNLSLVTTDLSMSMERIFATGVGEPLKTTVNAKQLRDVLERLRGEEVVLDYCHSTEQLQVSDGGTSYKLPTLPADEFPNVPKDLPYTRICIEQGELRRMIQETVYAAGDDEARPIMTALSLVRKDHDLTLMGTDTHRLAISHGKSVGREKKALALLVPADAMREVVRHLADDSTTVDIEVCENIVRFLMPPVTITSRLLEGKFPDTERVIPKEHDREWVLNAGKLRKALRQVSLVAKNNVGRVMFTREGGTLRVSAQDSESECVTEIPVWAGMGKEDMAIAFNYRYVTDALKRYKDADTVTWELQGHLNPMAMRHGHGFEIIMPMSLPEAYD